MAIHQLVPELLTREVRVTVIGAGGSGSQMLMGLAQLHTAMIALGHPGGLDVTVSG
jgi:pyruvate/2-oxoglutarate dehydrogenase complex dihydrolipoamide dehydrogenase (E3) component